MEITAERIHDGAVTLLTLEGELDASNFEAVIDAARVAAAGGSRALVIDLERVSYMGSSGLVALHSAAALMHGQEPPSLEGGWSALHRVGDDVSATRIEERVVLVAPQRPVTRVLERSGMARIFTIHPDRETALGSVAADGA
jgi:anti-anti-sigma regulatory factor